MKGKLFTKIAAVLLGIVALAHVLRLVFAVKVVIGTMVIPMGVSIGGIVVPGLLAVLLWREAGS